MSATARFVWDDPSDRIRSFFLALLEGAIEKEAFAADGQGALVLPAASIAENYFILERLASKQFLAYTSGTSLTPLATLVPLVSSFQFTNRTIEESTVLHLSSFALLHRRSDEMILETPLSLTEVILKTQEASSIIYALMKPTRFIELAQQFPHIHLKTMSDFLLILYNAEAIEDNEKTFPLSHWDFHDLYFHSRSRSGRHANPVGGSFRFRGKIPPLSAIKNLPSDKIFPLYKPNIEALKKHDVSFTQVLESRRSVRSPGRMKITVEHLGEFLYRSARIVKSFHSADMELSLRPSPGGGALHELELYPLIHECKGLTTGLYHYHPLEHRLELVRKTGLDALLEDAKTAMRIEFFPQVLIVISARFQRISWKYESMAYAGILKNVGALYQTMYLVATAMGIAPCALGNGNSDLFASMIHTNYYEESSVGEFVLT